MAVKINKLTNANVYVNGGSFLGQAMEIDLPAMSQKVADHVALGMLGVFETNTGVDKMESTIRWAGPSTEIFTAFANPNVSVELQIRGNIQEYGSTGVIANKAYTVYMTVQSKSAPLGNIRQHENAEFENALAVHYIKVEFDGVPSLEFDVLANVYKVDGVDIAADYRANLGI